jgi:hypothetical protein
VTGDHTASAPHSTVIHRIPRLLPFVVTQTPVCSLNERKRRIAGGLGHSDVRSYPTVTHRASTGSYASSNLI